MTESEMIAGIDIGTLVYFEGFICARIVGTELETDLDGTEFIRYEINCPQRGGIEWVVREDFTLAQTTV